MAAYRDLARLVPGGTAWLLFACLLLCACSPGVAVTLVHPPPAAPVQLVVNDIDAEDAEGRRLARIMREALLDRLLRAEAFAVVFDRDRQSAGRKALLLEGILTEADAGSDALRFVIGSGLGRPHLAASFRLLDREGVAYLAFSTMSREAGPAGLSGHWRPLCMEDLARDVGYTAGDALVRWSMKKELAAATMF